MYKPKTRNELKSLVDDLNIQLFEIDTSLINDMTNLFYKSKRKNFKGIETWNVSNVTDMSEMFSYAKKFNQPLNKWNVSNVANMKEMFKDSKFNGNISNWRLNPHIRILVERMFVNSPEPKWFNDILKS